MIQDIQVPIDPNSIPQGYQAKRFGAVAVGVPYLSLYGEIETASVSSELPLGPHLILEKCLVVKVLSLWQAYAAMQSTHSFTSNTTGKSAVITAINSANEIMLSTHEYWMSLTVAAAFHGVRAE